MVANLPIAWGLFGVDRHFDVIMGAVSLETLFLSLLQLETEEGVEHREELRHGKHPHNWEAEHIAQSRGWRRWRLGGLRLEGDVVHIHAHVAGKRAVA